MTAHTVREIASAAFTDAIEILGIIEVLEAGNQAAVTQHINAAGAGRAAEHIKRALFTRLHFLVARAFGRTRPDDRHARRAFELLEDVTVAQKMNSKADLIEAQQRWKKCCDDPRLEPFLHFRDKYLAHLGQPRPGVGLPTYGDVFAIARDTAYALEKLAHASNVVTLSLDSQIPAHKESAEHFWARWRTSTDTPEVTWPKERKLM
jgi:hypothetical protein